MYNSVTINKIENVPPLKKLDTKRLPQMLTEAYSRIISARLSVNNEKDEKKLNEILDKIERLGYTYLAMINFIDDIEKRKSTAFVAATAFQLVAMHSKKEQKGIFTKTHVCPTCCAALLFLVADAPSDAVAVFRYLSEEDGDDLQRYLKQAVRYLAEGNFGKRTKDIYFGSFDNIKDKTEQAVAVLYNQILEGILKLYGILIGEENFDETVKVFKDIKNLCVEEYSDLIEGYQNNASHFLSTFPGPFLFASLLENVAHSLFNQALINVATPKINNLNKWKNEIARVIKIKPYLWSNHKRIVEKYAYLDRGVSIVLSLPTGAGKTTLSQLKAISALVDNYKIIFLAPTHALVNQATKEWQQIFPDKQVKNSFLFTGEYDETEDDVLPDITIMTPERCLSLLTISPDAFNQVGLIIIDECHILHAETLEASFRATDAMYCLHRFFDVCKNADFLLMSAMIDNTQNIAEWIEKQICRKCVAIQDEWKPTRQVRSCVVYSHKETSKLQETLKKGKREAIRKKRKYPGVSLKKELYVQPFGFFCLNQTWHTEKLRDYRVLPISDEKVLLGANNYWGLTSNRNEVSASLAIKLVSADIKTIIFTQQINYTQSIARLISKQTDSQGSFSLNEKENELWNILIEEIGASDCIYKPEKGVVACHHGLLLPKERELIESAFTRINGIKVLVATPTLAQGMNLPAEAVIIAGEDRYDIKKNSQNQLEAHELLNAAGRAGRAGHHAQGFVLIVPGEVVYFNDENNEIGQKWFSLKESVFSKSDQCLSIIDPLQRLIDAIQNEIIENEKSAVEYILRRIPYNPDLTPEENVRNTLQRSYAAFIAKKNGNEKDFEGGIKAIEDISLEIIKPINLVENQWIIPIATEFGINANLLLDIENYLDDINVDWSLPEYINWFFNKEFIFEMIKKRTFIEITNTLRTSEERKENKQLKKLINKRLKKLLISWIKGATLKELELQIGTSEDKIGKCDKARKLVLRWIPDIAYCFGAITRLYRKRCELNDSFKMPTMLAALASCIKSGVDMPEKLAILHINNFEISRKKANKIFNEILNYLNDGEPYEKFAQTKQRIKNAINILDL